MQRNTKKTEGRSGAKTHKWRPNCWRNVANVPWSINYTTMEWSKYQTGLWIIQSVSAQWNCRVSICSDYNAKFRKILEFTLYYLCYKPYFQVLKTYIISNKLFFFSYFLDNAKRICNSDYVPTMKDILHSRLKTVGVIELQIKMKGADFRVIDVGGQRTQRTKW